MNMIYNERKKPVLIVVQSMHYNRVSKSVRSNVRSCVYASAPQFSCVFTQRQKIMQQMLCHLFIQAHCPLYMNNQFDFFACCRPFLNASKRELLADCALPVSVLLMSFFGSYVFRDVKRQYTLNKWSTVTSLIVGLSVCHVCFTKEIVSWPHVMLHSMPSKVHKVGT